MRTDRSHPAADPPAHHPAPPAAPAAAPAAAPPHVLIIGAGIGGLCLANGLKRSGIGVTVYERDASAQARAQD